MGLLQREFDMSEMVVLKKWLAYIPTYIRGDLAYHFENFIQTPFPLNLPSRMF